MWVGCFPQPSTFHIAAFLAAIYAVIQVRNPRGDTDFCLAGCHGQTHAAKVTAGRRVRQIGVQIFSDLRKIRCRDIGFSSFRCGR